MDAWMHGDGGFGMEDGGWRMEDGGWRMEDGGWRMGDGDRSNTYCTTTMQVYNLKDFRRPSESFVAKIAKLSEHAKREVYEHDVEMQMYESAHIIEQHTILLAILLSPN